MNKVPAKASDPNDLERHILDPNIAKSEAEWWAKSRIEELERELFNTEADRQLQLELKTTYMRELNELERKRDSFYMDYRMKCDEETKALQADNARLREALGYALQAWQYDGISDEHGSIALEVESRLASTPEQSLAALTERIRAEAFAEVADKLEALRNRLNSALSTKEPE